MDDPPPVPAPRLLRISRRGPESGIRHWLPFCDRPGGPNGPLDPARGGPGKQDAIDYAMEEIKQDNRRVHIIADFKMKILQRYSFDSTTARTSTL